MPSDGAGMVNLMKNLQDMYTYKQIGNELTLRFFNPKTKLYEDKSYREQMEIANLTGNISLMDGKTYLHLHVTVGRSDYSALAGHLLAATLNGAGEFVVEDFGTSVTRVYVPEIGLNCYKLDK